MWILHSEIESGVRYCLLPGEEYSVGRLTKSNIPIPQTDSSVSRRHASIAVDKQGNVTVHDASSTFGSYVGERAIESSGNSSQADRIPKGSTKGSAMTSGDRVRFGLLSSVFKLEKTELVVTTSGLNRDDRNRLNTELATMPGASVVSAWSDRVTHVAMSSVMLTIKAVNALARGVPIVKPDFVYDLCLCARTKQQLPDAASYVPQLGEPTLNRQEVRCAADPKRRSLFLGLTFVFADREQMSKYSTAIAYAGGKAVDASSKLAVDNTAKVILIRPPQSMLCQTSSANDTQLSGVSASLPPQFKKLAKEAKRTGLSLIPEQNVGIAILKSSCHPDLDPKVKTVVRSSASSSSIGGAAASQSHTILAPDTQKINLASAPAVESSLSTRRIPETLPTPTPTPAPSSVASKRPSQPAWAEDEEDETCMLSEAAPSKLRRSKRGRSDDTTTISSPPAKKCALNLEEDIMEEKGEEMEKEPTVPFTPLPATNSTKVTTPAETVSPRRSPRGRTQGSPEKNATPPKESRSTSPKKSPRAVRATGDEGKSAETSRLRPAKRRRLDIPNSEGSDGEKTPREEVGKDETDVFSENCCASTPSNAKNQHEQGDSRKHRLLKGFLSKATAAQVLAPDVSVTHPGVTLEELSRSYCRLEVTPLVVANRRKPTYVPSTRPSDLGKYVKNVKVFKKQQILRPSQRYYSMVPSSQVAAASNVSGGERENLDNWVERREDASCRDESDKEDEEDDLWQFPKGSSSAGASTSKRQ